MTHNASIDFTVYSVPNFIVFHPILNTDSDGGNDVPPPLPQFPPSHHDADELVAESSKPPTYMSSHTHEHYQSSDSFDSNSEGNWTKYT